MEALTSQCPVFLHRAQPFHRHVDIAVSVVVMHQKLFQSGQILVYRCVLDRSTWEQDEQDWTYPPTFVDADDAARVVWAVDG